MKQRKRKLSAWNKFVRNRRRRMRGGNFDMAGLANEWAEMSSTDKMQFEEEIADEPGHVVSTDVADEDPGPYAVSKEDLPRSSQLAGPHASAWSEYVGEYIAAGKDDIIIEPEMGELCSDVYGPGLCARELTDAEHAQFKRIDMLLKKTAYDKYESGQDFQHVHRGIGRTLLYCLKFELDLDIDAARGLILIQLATTFSPLRSVLLIIPIDVDDEFAGVVNIDYKFSLRHNKSLARLCIHRRTVEMYRINYTIASLTSFYIGIFDFITPSLLELGKRKRKRNKNPLMELIATACSSVGKRMTHKERRRAQRRSERRNRPGAARSDSDGSEVPDASAGDELSDCSSDVSVTGDGDGGDVSDTVAVCDEWGDFFQRHASNHALQL